MIDWNRAFFIGRSFATIWAVVVVVSIIVDPALRDVIPYGLQFAAAVLFAVGGIMVCGEQFYDSWLK